MSIDNQRLAMKGAAGAASFHQGVHNGQTKYKTIPPNTTSPPPWSPFYDEYGLPLRTAAHALASRELDPAQRRALLGASALYTLDRPLFSYRVSGGAFPEIGRAVQDAAARCRHSTGASVPDLFLEEWLSSAQEPVPGTSLPGRLVYRFLNRGRDEPYWGGWR